MSESRTQLTNHGASLESTPRRERWRETPVCIREDIYAAACRSGGVRGETLAEDLAIVMKTLSLETARFGGLGDDRERVDALVKEAVRLHHETWIMRPLEALYDHLVAMQEEVGA